MSIAIPQLPKGTRDFYPDDERIQNYIFDTWRKVAESFAYEEYEGPMFEHLELYTGKSGDEIVSQLYNFKDKGDREIALRPEMTPTLARLVIQKARELKKPFKWFSMPRLFRYEKAQKGRLREFFQLNMDIIGAEDFYAEADLMAAIATMLRKFGLKDCDFAIGVSSRKLLATYLEEIGAPNPSLVYPVLDRRLKIGPETFAKALTEAGLSEAQIKQLDDFMSCKSIEEVKAAIKSENATAALKEIKDLFATLAAAGFSECVNLDLSIVRGLAYYTGIVFEVFDKGKSMRAIAGGGRYDSLTEKLGGERIPCVGFGMGDVVLKNLLEEKKNEKEEDLIPKYFSQKNVDFYIASFSGDMKKIFETATKFRKLSTAGGYHAAIYEYYGGDTKKYSVATPLAPMKLKKQLDQANHLGAKIVVYVDGSKANPEKYEFEYKDLRNGKMGCGDINQIIEDLKNEDMLEKSQPLI